MSKIDTLEWKEFILGELFDLINSKAYHGKDISETPDEDGLLYVTRSKFNNGINCRVEKKSDYIINPAGTISFGAENADFFYQEEEYITGNKMYYIDTRNINKYAALYFKSVLEATFTRNYSFSDGMIPDRIRDKIIKLPATDKGEPDWNYMEEYMKNVETSVRNSLEKLQSAKECKNKIDIVEWKEYFINDLFDFEGIKGDIQAPKVGDGEYALVSSGTTNNGICKNIEEQKSSNLFDENKITIDMFGKAFFQTQKFYSVAHARVNVLTPHMSLNKYNGCFIASVIEALTLPKFQFNDMCSQKALKKEKIKLPSKFNVKTGKYEPDLEYMEKFMKDVEEKTKARLNSLI